MDQAKGAPTPLLFIRLLLDYLQLRIRQITLFTYAAWLVLFGAATEFKSIIVRSMFWGRGSLYRTAFHLVISIITVSIVLTGVSSRFNIISANSTAGLDINSGIVGRQDLFAQAGTAESLSSIEEEQYDFEVKRHQVASGDTLSTIAATYGVNMSTIVWANSLPNESTPLSVGKVLRIPLINGVFVKVQKGDTLEKIATKYKGSVPDIIDLNTNVIDPQNPVIAEGLELFVVGGEIPQPPAPVVVATRRGRPASTVVAPPSGGGVSIPAGTFINPLRQCPGYSYSRGFTSYHGGVDLAKAGGCIESAAAAGRVLKAQFGTAGVGNHVVVDHGNGVWTRYYHGSGKYYVRAGDYVEAGQALQWMGCTGRCTGTHLHFEIVINGRKVNPEAYVRLRP